MKEGIKAPQDQQWSVWDVRKKKDNFRKLEKCTLKIDLNKEIRNSTGIIGIKIYFRHMSNVCFGFQKDE